MDYLDLLEKAAQIYPNDEVAQKDFVKGFITKVANILKDVAYSGDKMVGTGDREMPLRKQVLDNFWGRGVATAAGKALVGGGMGIAVAGIGSLVKTVVGANLHNLYLRALNEAVQNNRILREAPKQKVLNFGNTIFKFAPHVATDPNILSTILGNAVQGEYGIDPMTIRTLTELESRYQQNQGETMFNPKSWI